MDEIRRILVFILCGLCAVSALSGRGYFCRDPDTGKLHPANSTWPSITFCGNYTCKLRRKPLSGSEPMRELNITNVNITQTFKARNEDAHDGEFSASNITPQILIPKDTPNGIDKTLFHPQLHNELNSIQERLKKKLELEGGDRFLTDTEIKTISDLLHNVKKSDLEAIVDIYNLAQDIYKEMDKMTSENIVEETMRLAQNIKTGNKHTSYWYDPVNQYNKAEIKTDMEHQGTNPVPTAAQPKPIANPHTYFSGPLSKTDFGKLPYYYPMSSFQRQSSYVHPTYNPQFQPPPPPANVKPPCSNKNLSPVVYPPPPPQYNYPPPQGYPLSQNYPPQNYGGVMKRPFIVDNQKIIQPSVLLPYPFSYIQHYNNSSTYPYNQYGENPMARFDINSQNSNAPKGNSEESPNNTIPDTDKKESSQVKTEVDKTNILDGNLLENLIAKAKIVKKPEWLTDPLPENVLEEVRAHFEEKAKLLKPFSLRKKVKLERVGKVVKLDDLNREKRSIDDAANIEKVENEEDLEAYIEKTTCRSDNDPGFFRMGNLSEPYPACCPQRIDNDNR